MVLTDSSLALLIKPQVLITTILASSFIASCVTSLPLAFSCPISTSLSYTFLEQPNVTTLILFFFNDLVLIPLKLRGQNYDFNLYLIVNYNLNIPPTTNTLSKKVKSCLAYSFLLVVMGVFNTLM